LLQGCLILKAVVLNVYLCLDVISIGTHQRLTVWLTD